MPFRGIEGLSGPVHFCAAAKAKSQPVQWYTLRPLFIFATGNLVEFDLRVTAPENRFRWLKITISPKDRLGDGAVLGTAVDITRIKEREDSNFWLTRELMHRSRNLLSDIQSMARHSARMASSYQEFNKRFLDRLQAISAVHDLLVASGYTQVNLVELILSQTQRDDGSADSRVLTTGEPIDLNPHAAQAFGMALNELYMNARLHGALKTPTGRIAISWGVKSSPEGETLDLIWKESGAITRPEINSAGFGTFMITTNLPRSLNGSVERKNDDDGLVYHMDFPIHRLRASDKNCLGFKQSPAV